LEVRVSSEPNGDEPSTLQGWIERDAAVVWHGFTQMSTFGANSPLMVESAEGRELIDVDGVRYFDAISSLWVTTLGHRVPELDQALTDQLGRVAHSTMLGNGNRIVVEFSEALVAVVPVDEAHVLYAADGAAAVEQALKIAFQYWVNRGVTGRTQFLTFGGAYHGDTVGSLSLGDSGFGTDIFDPLRFATLRAPGYEDPDCIATAIAMIEANADHLAAVVVEPLIQGAAGMMMRPANEFAALGEACRDNDVLLVCDEVAVGFGRTGTLFASEQCGLRPDVMTLGKGITGGYLAMSATVASAKVFDAFLGEDLGPKTLYHGHSYGGNALAAAVALRHLRLIEEWDVLANVRARGSQLARRLGALDTRAEVKEVRQVGLMAGIEMAPPEPDLRWGRRISAACVDAGVLVRPLGDVIVLVPPLTTTEAELDHVVDVVIAAIDGVCGT
jgi:adenosylmethionine-8-amino-7-oxononanoate aminotransferase